MKRSFWAFFAAMILFVGCDALLPITDDDKDPDKEQTDDPNKEDPDKDDPNQDDPNQDGPNQDDPNQDDPNQDDPNQDDPNQDDPNQDDLQPSAQKAKIAEVGEKLMDMCPASDFEDIPEIMEGFAEAYFTDEYNWDAVSEWFDNAIDTAYKSEESYSFNGSSYTTEWMSELIILLSNHTGYFTMGQNAVTVSSYDGLAAECYVNGKKYVAEIKSSGKVTEAIYTFVDNWGYSDSGYYDEEKGCWVDFDELIDIIYNDTYKFKVGVPEKVTIDLTEDGASKAEIVVTFKPELTASGIDLTTDAFAVQASVKTYGYEMIISNASYNAATGKAEFKQELKKDGASMIKSSASGNVSLSWKEGIDEESSWGWDDYLYAEVAKADSFEANLDIIGEIQVKGSCSDAFEAAESLDLIWDALYNSGSETDAERHLNNLNSKIDFNVYYDGGSKKQASVEFDLQCYKYDADEYWSLIPVIVFNDGSKYKIEEFFTENAFGDLIESFEAFCESFAEVLAIDL